MKNTTLRKAYSARGHRTHLRSRGVTAVIPEPSDQIRHRQNKGAHGGRPVAFDARAATCADWLHNYNHHRPHTGIGGQVPADRVHSVTGNHT